MPEKKEVLRPSQPYFVFDTNDFYQELYLKQGISHFYTFHVKEGKPLRSVPDGCIDLFFEYEKDKMHGYVCGTPLKYSCENWRGRDEVFGIRFMPGVQPELVSCRMKEALGKKLPIESVLTGDKEWLDKIRAEKDFYQRIRIFIEANTKAEKRRRKPFGKQEMVQSVKRMVYETDGRIRVYEMEEKTGYSVRYLNKAFIEEMGFSPKTFCKIIQFQRAIEMLNYGAPESMTELSVSLGYYDQPQFIHDFSRYAGITPRKYLKLVEEKNYKNRINQR